MPALPLPAVRYTAVGRSAVRAWYMGRCPPNDSSADATECPTEWVGDAVGLRPKATAPLFLFKTPIFTVSVETVRKRNQIATKSLKLLAV